MKIAAVIVTYNRIELLKEVLSAFNDQIVKPDYLIIVNNASTDGTEKYLADWEKETLSLVKKIVITNQENVGGSGGFYVGTSFAMELEVDWIWVSDDDAIPEKNVFSNAIKHINGFNETDNIAALCTSVKTNGEIEISNRSLRKKTFREIKLVHIPTTLYTQPFFYCDAFSYVGVLMNANKLQEIGLIHAEYFIWRDDVEHSWRLSKTGKIVCYTDMVVDHRIHKTDYEGVSWKTYYAYRNDLLMLKEHNEKRCFYMKILSAFFHALLSKKKRCFKLYIDAVVAAYAGEEGVNLNYTAKSFWK